MSTSRALSFGSAASAYERFRPGYPHQLVDEVLEYASGPVRTALEIGAGTGKATCAFAARGIAVTATDPDPAMLAELGTHVPNAATIEAPLEALPLTEAYDLVFAAAALHWTDPLTRWSRIAALTRPGGVFASFGGQVHLADPDVERAVVDARSELLASDDVPSPDGTPADSAMPWPGTDLLRSADFTDVRQSIVDRRLSMSPQDYLGHLSTVSAYLQLPAPVRAEVFDRISRVLPERVHLVADLVIHLARRTQTHRR